MRLVMEETNSRKYGQVFSGRLDFRNLEKSASVMGSDDAYESGQVV